LGKDYKIVASVGHVRDLPKSQMGVDIENDFTPKYITIRGKGEIISKLKKEAKNASISILQPTLTVRVRLFRGIWLLCLT